MKNVTSLSVLVFSLLLLGAGCTVSTTGTGSSSSSGAPSADAVEGAWAAGVVDQGGLSGDALAGTINGNAVDIASVTIEDWGDKFQWSFSNEAPSSTCGFTTGDDAVKFRSAELMEGTFTKGYETDVDFDEFSSYYKYERPEGGPHSVNTGWEATIVVTDFTESVGETNFGKNIGSAEGFVQIAFEDGQTEIAGAFTADVCEK